MKIFSDKIRYFKITYGGKIERFFYYTCDFFKFRYNIYLGTGFIFHYYGPKLQFKHFREIKTYYFKITRGVNPFTQNYFKNRLTFVLYL